MFKLESENEIARGLKSLANKYGITRVSLLIPLNFLSSASLSLMFVRNPPRGMIKIELENKIARRSNFWMSMK